MFLLEPFYQLQFVDIYKDHGEVTLAALDNPERLFKMGRPFWGSIIESLSGR
jgi:hypothetical protein